MGAPGSCSSRYTPGQPSGAPAAPTLTPLASQPTHWAPAGDKYAASSSHGNFSRFVIFFFFLAVIFLFCFLCYLIVMHAQGVLVWTCQNGGGAENQVVTGRSDPGSESDSVSVGMKCSGLQKVPTSVREANVLSSLFWVLIIRFSFIILKSLFSFSSSFIFFSMFPPYGVTPYTELTQHGLDMLLSPGFSVTSDMLALRLFLEDQSNPVTVMGDGEDVLFSGIENPRE